jgi:hypothetical protein
MSNNRVNYSDAPEDIEKSLEGATIIDDFLPSPEELVRKTAKEKITIALDKNSLDLYKRYAKKHNTKYQSMINDVVGAYADKFLK